MVLVGDVLVCHVPYFRLIVFLFPMVLALGPKFRIPTQIFKCQSDLCEVVSVLCARQVAV